MLFAGCGDTDGLDQLGVQVGEETEWYR